MRNGCWVPWSHTRNMMILEGGECFWDGAFQSRPGMAEDYFCWHASPCCLWNTHLQHRQKRNNIYQEKRILIENKSNSSLEDPVWRTVRYIWLLQILTALRVSENFWMWCQKKGWLHQSTVVSKTCKKPSKRFCEITSQTSHNSVLPKRLLSCGVRSVYHHPPPRFCSLYPQQQRYHPVPRCPQVQRWPFRAMFLPSGCPWRFQWILNLLPGVYEAKNQKKLLLLHNSV